MAAQVQKDWLIEMKKKVEHVRHKLEEEDEKLWRKHTIYKVPPYMSGIKCSAHRPKMVSFGPYHHDDEALQPMEQHKIRGLHHFLARSNRHVEEYVKALDDVVEDLMDCYDQLPERWRQNRKDFLQLMLRDGCFMLEILYQKFDGYDNNDPIFSQHGLLHKMPHIKRDMLLIENQLPLLVLETLVAVGRDETEVNNTFECSTQQKEAIKKEESLYSLILKFCGENQVPTIQKGLHVLDVVRQSMLVDTCGSLRNAKGCCGSIIRSATELAEAGINFRKSRTNSLKDISFNVCWETLKLPAITIDDSTEFKFLNLMAFERLHTGAGSEVTSYIFFMDNLIDTPNDVNLLRSRDIIINALGSDEAVAKLFNEISTDITLDPNCSLNQIRSKLYEQCQSCWKKSKANLKHTYFRSPWASISVVAAGFLLILSVTQTIFAILDYFKPIESPKSSMN
ncbi:hypothetical protein ACLOJK_023876 [Asimina triloba]